MITVYYTVFSILFLHQSPALSGLSLDFMMQKIDQFATTYKVINWPSKRNSLSFEQKIDIELKHYKYFFQHSHIMENIFASVKVANCSNPNQFFNRKLGRRKAEIEFRNFHLSESEDGCSKSGTRSRTNGELSPRRDVSAQCGKTVGTALRSYGNACYVG